MTRDEVLLARGRRMPFALRRRYHDDAVASRYAPTGPLARDIYDAMENARCEAVGCARQPGTAGETSTRRSPMRRTARAMAQVTQASEVPLRWRQAIWCGRWRRAERCRNRRSMRGPVARLCRGAGGRDAVEEP